MVFAIFLIILSTVHSIEVLIPCCKPYEHYNADFGPQYDTIGTLTAADPLDGCVPFNNASNMTNRVALVKRGLCTFAG